MEDSNLAEQDYGDATSFAFNDFGHENAKETFNVAPLDVRAERMGVDRLQRSLVRSLHTKMVPRKGTVFVPMSLNYFLSWSAAPWRASLK